MYRAGGKAKRSDIPQCAGQSIYKQTVAVAVQGQVEYEVT